MALNELKKSILERAPAAYRSDFEESEIDEHIGAIDSLSPRKPYVLSLSGDPDSCSVTVVGYDRPGLFSMITGLLSSAGLSIVRGQVYTLQANASLAESGAGLPRSGGRKPSPFEHPRLGRRRFAGGSSAPGGEAKAHARSKVIVDRFTGSLTSDRRWEEFASRLEASFSRLFETLEKDGDEAGRRYVAEEVAARIAELPPSEGQTLSPIHVEEMAGDQSVTRFSIRTADTPFFLYSFSHALSLHDISIERVDIQTVGTEIRDLFEVVGSSGKPIRDRARLDRIRLSILLTKQFTFVLDRAPDPYAAMERFDRLIQDLGETEAGPDLRRLLSDRDMQRELAVLLGASDFIWEDFVRQQRENLLPMLEQIEEHRLLSFEAEEMEDRLAEAIADAAAHETTEIKGKDPADPVAARVEALNSFKDRQSFLIDLDHMLSPDINFFFLSQRLTALAEAVVRTALALAWESTTARYGTPRTAAGLPARYATFGLGKFGGSALGYASDIELLFIYSDSGSTDGPERVQNAEYFEYLFRTATGFIRARREGIFQTDLRLRPYGEDGPLACTLERFVEYYTAGGPAHAVERLALVRLRQIDGDSELGRRVTRIRDDILYQRDSIDISAVRELRRTQLEEKLDGARLNAKFSPGGLVDVEYNVQILQIGRGRHNRALRCPGIHDALEALRDEGTIKDEEADAMIAAYRFLRRLINGLRMLRGNAQDLFMPPFDSPECAHLARRIGYRRGEELSEAQQLKLDFETHTAFVRAFVERHLGVDAIPGEVEGGPADLVLSGSLSESHREAILKRAGVRDPARSFANICEIRRIVADDTRFSRVLILAWDPLSRVPDADMALNNWERFVRSRPHPEGHLSDILEQPERLEILFTIFSGSQFLSDTLASDPDVFAWITEPETVERTYSDVELARELRAEWQRVRARDRDAWLAVLRRFRKRHILRIGTRDICLGAALPVVTTEISSLARAVVRVGLEAVWAREVRRWSQQLPVRSGREGRPEEAPDGATGAGSSSETTPPPAVRRSPAASARRLSVFAFGKLGGDELNYSSDIDLLAVFEPEGASGETAAYTEVVRSLIRDLTEFTTEGQCYRVDMRLRPHGIAGALVLPAERALEYYRTEAELWEKQALLKLGPIAGSRPVGERFMSGIRRLFTTPVSPSDARAGIAHLRRLSVEQAVNTTIARTASTDIKNDEGGIRDIEFGVQLLQLTNAHEDATLLTGNTLSALAVLADAGLIEHERAEQLRDDYIFLRKIEHFLQLYGDRQLHALPTDEIARSRMAHTVGITDGGADFFELLSACMRRTREFYRSLIIDTS